MQISAETYIRPAVLIFLLAVAMGGCIESGKLTVEDDSASDQEDDEIIVIDTPGSSQQPTGQSTPPANDDDDPDQPSADDDGDDATSPTCEDGEALCDEVCIDVTQDDANCGGCGVMCGDGLICMEADCVCEVGELCEGDCVDTTANAAHCGACNRACSGGQACVDGDCQTLTEVEGVLLATNQARAAGQNCGVYGEMPSAPPLEGDPNLHLAAQVHADDMAENNFFSHTGSDGSSFSQRISRTNFQGQPIGENIAAGNATAEATVNQWIQSDGHCRNLMNPNARMLGVGYAQGGPYGTLWVQVFAQ